MSVALILQHAEAFGPGRVVPVFRDFGIPIDDPLAQESSVADQLVQDVLKNVERYGMYLAD